MILKKKIESWAPVSSPSTSAPADHDQVSRLYKRLKVEHATKIKAMEKMQELNIRLQTQLLDKLRQINLS